MHVTAIGSVLVLVILVAFALLKSGRGIVWAAPGRRPRRRHIVTRIICGVLGVLILGAVAVGTWRDVRGRYQPDEEVEALAVHVPTKPAPLLPVPPEPSGMQEIESARLLLHFVTVDASSGRFRPVRADEYQIRWPEDRGRNYGTRFELYGIKIDYSFSIDGVHARRANSGEPPALELHVSQRFAWAGMGGSGTSTGGGRLRGEVTHWENIGPSRLLSDRPLSVIPGPRRDLRIFCVVTPVAEDDPLKQVAATEFVLDRQTAMLEAMSQSGSGTRVARFSLGGPARPMRAAALAAHIGTSILLLLAAAILLTQLFTRRSLAFAGVLAAVVLYMAALDRMALGAHLSRLSDAKASVETRLTACAQAGHTFFYRQTAHEALEELAVAEDTPPLLREAATATAAVLGDSEKEQPGP